MAAKVNGGVRKGVGAGAMRAVCGLALAMAGTGWVDQAHAASGCSGVSYGTLPVEMVNERATTMVKINGKDMRFILDTGAFFSIMSRATAASLGLKLEMLPVGFHINGIGGEAGANLTTVRNFGILGANLPNIQFLVGGSDAGTGLLGSNLLDMVDLDADLSQGKASLVKPSGCGNASMAYWAKDGVAQEAKLLAPKHIGDRASRIMVFINGKPVRAELDTGATTLITRKAAERVGIDMGSAAVTPGGISRGFGAKTHNAWIARVAMYQVGTESIQNSRMRVIDDEFDPGSDPTEMLLGIDFFLSHHIFIANSQRKVYFTYNGGRVSVHDKLSELSPASKPATVTNAKEPESARDLGLRGQAHISRGETAEGIADLDKAIAMAPDAPDSAPFYYERARARMTGRMPSAQGDVMLADLDASLRLAPGRPEVLLDRARVLLARRQRDRAEADIAEAGRVVAPGSSQSLTLAQMLIGLDRPAQALPWLDTWVKLHGEDSRLGDVLNTRCWARGLANVELTGAQEDCRKAIRRDGDKPGILDSQALVELRLGNNQQALDIYARALAKEPKMGWARYGQALARLRLGQDAGKADLAAVQKDDPGIVARATRLGLTPP